jgi:ADP-ribose pyrophosphatase YjhB (NUDIX family)
VVSDVLVCYAFAVIKYQFCPKCGGGLKPKNASLLVCGVCSYHFYQNSKPTAKALIIEDGKILLGIRAVDPFKGHWNIPGGFLEYGEDPKDCAKREAQEETGLEVQIGELLGIFTDFYGVEKNATINIAYMASRISGEVKPGDELVELGWFSPDNLPNTLASECNAKMLEAWKRL